MSDERYCTNCFWSKVEQKNQPCSRCVGYLSEWKPLAATGPWLPFAEAPRNNERKLLAEFEDGEIATILLIGDESWTDGQRMYHSSMFIRCAEIYPPEEK